VTPLITRADREEMIATLRKFRDIFLAIGDLTRAHICAAAVQYHAALLDETRLHVVMCADLPAEGAGSG
jgi:hypothetical protein